MKLIKQKYYNSTGESKVNCYLVKIPKAILAESEIKDTDEIKLSIVDGKIVIERA